MVKNKFIFANASPAHDRLPENKTGFKNEFIGFVVLYR